MVAETSSKKLKTELFDDLPVLQRKWQAAVRPGEKLPRYEDVMLGSLGRLADHIVLLKRDQDALEDLACMLVEKAARLGQAERPLAIKQADA